MRVDFSGCNLPFSFSLSLRLFGGAHARRVHQTPTHTDTNTNTNSRKPHWISPNKQNVRSLFPRGFSVLFHLLAFRCCAPSLILRRANEFADYDDARALAALRPTKSSLAAVHFNCARSPLVSLSSSLWWPLLRMFARCCCRLLSFGARFARFEELALKFAAQMDDQQANAACWCRFMGLLCANLIKMCVCSLVLFLYSIRSCLKR